jgi:hypothetical protein
VTQTDAGLHLTVVAADRVEPDTVVVLVLE